MLQEQADYDIRYKYYNDDKWNYYVKTKAHTLVRQFSTTIHRCLL